MLTSVGVAKLSGACLVQYHDPSPPVCINGLFSGAFQANIEPIFKAGIVSHLLLCPERLLIKTLYFMNSVGIEPSYSISRCGPAPEACIITMLQDSTCLVEAWECTAPEYEFDQEVSQAFV